MRYTIVGLLFFFPHLLLCQRIVPRNGADLYIYYGPNLFIGDAMVSAGAFKYPALFSNMTQSNSVEIQYAKSVRRFIYVGVNAGQTSMQGWTSNDGSTAYTGTTVGITNFSALAMCKVDLSNKLSWHLSVLPGLGRVDVLTSATSEVNNGSNATPFHSITTDAQLAVRAGMNLILKSNLGISLSVGYQTWFLNSNLYVDKRATLINGRLGLFWRLEKNRKYRYSDL